MRNLKKLPASLLLTLALTLPAFAGIIECPVQLTPPDSPATIQTGPNVGADSAEAEGFEPEGDESLLGAALTLLQGVALTLF